MYILVRLSDNVIVTSATRPVDESAASASGCMVFEIDDSDFSVELIGSKLESFDEVK